MSQIKQLALQPLFYSPLLIFEVNDAPALNKALKQQIKQLQASSPGLNRSNIGGWHSEDDLFDRTEPCFKQLCQQIIEAVNASTKKIAPTFDFEGNQIHMQGWVNVQQKGSFNTPHDHAMWAWSGVYYAQVPETKANSMSGCIEFLDSRTNLHPQTIAQAPCFATKYQFKPKAGQMIIFPSYLSHWVYPNDSEEARISIAFNARFAQKNRS